MPAVTIFEFVADCSSGVEAMSLVLIQRLAVTTCVEVASCSGRGSFAVTAIVLLKFNICNIHHTLPPLLYFRSMSSSYNPPPDYEPPKPPPAHVSLQMHAILDLSAPEFVSLLCAGSTPGVAVPSAARQNQSQFTSVSKLFSIAGISGLIVFSYSKEDLTDLFKELGLSHQLRVAMLSAIHEWKRFPHLALEAISMSTAKKPKTCKARAEQAKEAKEAILPPCPLTGKQYMKAQPVVRTKKTLTSTVTNQSGKIVTYTYEGEVNARGYEDGQGRSSFSHGDEYTGQWRNGKQDGQGTFRYADGTMHTGTYKDGVRNGPGTFKFADGAEHTGEYRNDCMHGWGTFKYSNGCVYTGEFFNGMQHGRGTLVYADGRREDGEFKNDVFVIPSLISAAVAGES